MYGSMLFFSELLIIPSFFALSISACTSGYLQAIRQAFQLLMGEKLLF